ncbi:MAG: 2-dehydropantoate 2-reductase [Bacteroidetes bacterium]|nr:2-dehydropantoate 2-reductase [Bacteroidota bacterium]
MAKVLIMGAGAVGGFYGSQLSSAGHEVFLVARGQHLEAIQQKGLRVESASGSFHSKLPASSNPQSFNMQPDYVFFAVKSYDTETAIEQIRALVGVHTQILALQNGVENYDLLSNAFGKKHVIRAYCRTNSEVVEPGVIRQQKFGQIVFNEDNGKPTDRIVTLRNMLEKADIDFVIPDDIRRAVWIKFTWNSVHNVLTGLLQKTVVELYKDEFMIDLMRRMTAEILSVAHAEGIDLKQSDVQEVIDEGQKLGAFRTSTYQDRERGKRLEFDAFTGAIVRLGKKRNVPTPVYDTLNALYRGLI